MRFHENKVYNGFNETENTQKNNNNKQLTKHNNKQKINKKKKQTNKQKTSKIDHYGFFTFRLILLDRITHYYETTCF